MKKILIISDTHGQLSLMSQIIDKEKPIDMLIHCGDLEISPSVFGALVDCPVHAIAGNNDYSAELPRIKNFNIGALKVTAVHGHRYRLYDGFTGLDYLARENHSDIVMFGHTHRPVVATQNGITFVNPGSVTYPRQEGHLPSYIIMNVDDKGDATYQIKYWGC